MDFGDIPGGGYTEDQEVSGLRYWALVCGHLSSLPSPTW